MNTKNFIQRPLREYIYALSEGNAAPGGGSAVALSGACACACALMAINFGLRSKKHREAHAQLRTLKKFFLTQRTFFLKAIDDDTRLYDAFDATRKHYKENPRLVRAYNKTVRDIIKIQYALVTAALASQKRLMGIYDKISRQLVADLEVAFFLFVASTEGGIKNCILNLTFLEDKAAARTLKQTLGGILQEKNSIYKMMRRL